MIHATLWLFVGLVATLAVYSSRINDTTIERVALSLVAITSFGACMRAYSGTYAADGDTSLAIAFAFYACVVARKNIKRQKPELPRDKTDRMPLWDYHNAKRK